MKNKDMNHKMTNYYLNLPYTIEVTRESDPHEPGWVARVVELPGCITQGDDFEELGEMVMDAMREWIEVALEEGQEIPQPRPQEDYSGKFVVRVPKSLHRRLVLQAEREGVSLNQFINVTLASAVGRLESGRIASQEYGVRYDERRLVEARTLHERPGAPMTASEKSNLKGERVKATALFGPKAQVLERVDADYKKWLAQAVLDKQKLTSSMLDELDL